MSYPPAGPATPPNYGMPQPPDHPGAPPNPFLSAPPPKKRKGLTVGLVITAVVLFLAGFGLWYFVGGGDDVLAGVEDPALPQRYEPLAEPYSGEVEVEAVGEFDLCAAFSHEGIETVLPVASADSFGGAPGEHQCKMHLSNSGDDVGDYGSQGDIWMRVSVLGSAEDAADAFNAALESRASSDPQPHAGLAVDSFVIHYPERNGKTAWLEAYSGNLYVQAQFNINRPYLDHGPPEVPDEVLGDVLADITNEAMTAIAGA